MCALNWNEMYKHFLACLVYFHFCILIESGSRIYCTICGNRICCLNNLHCTHTDALLHWDTHTLSRNAAREHNPWAVLLVWVRCNWVWLQFCLYLYLYCIRCMQFDCLFIYFAMALLFILIDIWVTHTRKFVVNNISLGVTLCHLCVCCCCCMYIYIYIYL